MAVNIPRGKSDQIIEQIKGELEAYEAAHGNAKIDVYRQNPVSVRIRVIDPSLKGLDRPERHNKVWPYLEKLPEDVQSDISMLVLLTPDEVENSFANLEFDDPIQSVL